jgi:hypothetical protein
MPAGPLGVKFMKKNLIELVFTFFEHIVRTHKPYAQLTGSAGETKKEHRVSWEIYTHMKKQPASPKALLHAHCRNFFHRMYRLGLGVSTGFCGLHHVRTTNDLNTI